LGVPQFRRDHGVKPPVVDGDSTAHKKIRAPAIPRWAIVARIGNATEERRIRGRRLRCDAHLSSRHVDHRRRHQLRPRGTRRGVRDHVAIGAAGPR